MFAKSAAFPLFPTLVRGFDLPEDAALRFNADLLAHLEAWFTPRPKLRPGETWQTTHDLHELAVFAPFHPFLDAAVSGVLQELAIVERDYVITGCWANVNPPAGFHPPHTHPNNILSGVYYAKTLPPNDAITFHDPRPQAGVIRPAAAQQIAETASEIEIEAKPGRMLLFPSWLRHSVKPNYTTDQERVSMSFNVMLADFVGRHTAPMWRGFRADGTRA